jgi:hypothetical protein
MPRLFQLFEDRIIITLQIYHASDKPKIARCVRKFNILYELFKGRVHDRKSRKDCIVPNKAIEPGQAQELMHWIDTLN